MKTGDKSRFIQTLQERFEGNLRRHPGLPWAGVGKALEARPERAVEALFAMENTGGEPDVVAYDKKSGLYTFCDCSAESPPGRRSLCYDRPALDSRKENKPSGSAVEMATAMGIELLTEEQYRKLQTLGEFDTKTSSWIKTPAEIRKRGGALFCDRRYGAVFTYHNGAESYYAARGFRGAVQI
jgi:hypothetical protein